MVRVPHDAADLTCALLIDAGAGGAVQEDLPHESNVSCFGEDPEQLARTAAAVRHALGAAGIRAAIRVGRAPRAYDSWRTEWARELPPVRIANDLWIARAGAPLPEGEDGPVVRLTPALAFGFGEHPTTRMAANEVCALVRGGARTVLDFGTGSGVLALVAARAGARRAVGLDVDAASVVAARDNAALNALGARCRFSGASLGRLRAVFDLIVANVDRGTLVRVSGALAARVAPRGSLLVTGFLSEDARAITEVFRSLGFAVTGRRREQDWVLLCLRRVSPRAARARLSKP